MPVEISDAVRMTERATAKLDSHAMRSGYAQMVASFDLCAGNFLRAVRCQLDRFVARPLVADADFQGVGLFFWKNGENIFSNRAGNPEIQLPAEHRDLTLIRDIHRILAVLLLSECELLALDLLEPSRREKVENHILGAFNFGTGRAGSLLEAVRFGPAIFHSAIHQCKESSNPVDLVAGGFAELLKSLQQLGGS
jgi:hypothetical protein